MSNSRHYSHTEITFSYLNSYLNFVFKYLTNVAIFAFIYPMQFKYGLTSGVQNKATYFNEI